MPQSSIITPQKQNNKKRNKDLQSKNEMKNEKKRKEMLKNSKEMKIVLQQWNLKLRTSLCASFARMTKVQYIFLLLSKVFCSTNSIVFVFNLHCCVLLSHAKQTIRIEDKQCPRQLKDMPGLKELNNRKLDTIEKQSFVYDIHDIRKKKLYKYIDPVVDLPQN